MEINMKYILFIFLLPITSFAAVCDITDNVTNSVMSQYQAPCDQSKYTGAFGDPSKTTHILDSDWRTAQALLVTEANAKDAKLQVIKPAVINCVKNWASLTANQQNACLLGAIKLLMLEQLKSGDL